MNDYKAKFIDFLLSNEVLKIGGPFELKSKRLSPYFLKLDSVNDGDGLLRLGEAYAEAILSNLKQDDFDGVIGIPQKCHTFGPAVAIGLATKNVNKKYSSYRDKPKTYGDATSAGMQDKLQLQKEYIIGSQLPDKSRQIIIDDVMTAGDAKNNALEMIQYLSQDVDIRFGEIRADS
ncbi:hypothetical protein HYZ41_03170 [archaeon]|nr:hypothetical protein [archaeon]